MEDKDRITIAGKEVLLSLGLLNDLAGIIGSPEKIGAVDFDSDMQAKVVVACLAERSPTGVVTKKVKYDELNLTIEETEKFLDSIKAAVLDFFLRRLTSTFKVMEARKDKLEQLRSSMSGLESLNSTS